MSDDHDEPALALTKATAGALSRWVGWLWYVGLSGLGCLVAIMLGFLGARHYADSLAEPIAVSEARIADGRMLRGYANELNALAADLANYADIARLGDPPADWVENDYRPRLNDYRRRLSGTAHRHDALNALLAAADSLANYASQPLSESYRQQMREDVVTAVGVAEAAIAEMGIAQYLGEPVMLPGL